MRPRVLSPLLCLLLGCASAGLAAATPDPSAEARKVAETIDPSGEPAKAEAAWRAWLALESAKRKPDPIQRAFALNRIGDTLYYQGKPALAQKELETAREVLEGAGLGESDAMAETLSNLGVMHSAQGRAGEDAEIQRRGLAIAARLHGAADPRLAINYFNLGNALYELGRLGEAADNIETATRMRLVTMKPDNPELFVSLASASSIVGTAGRLERAIDYAQQAVALAGKYHPNHPYSGFVRGVLAQALVNARRSSEAVEVGRLALDELGKTVGKDNPLTLTAMSNLAVALAQLGRFDEAAELQLASVGNKPESAPAQAVLGLISAANIAAEAGRDAQALAIAEQGDALATRLLPPDHSVRAQMAKTLAIQLDRQGQTGRALERMRAAEVIFARSEDRQSARRAEADIYLGAIEMKAGLDAEGYQRLSRAAAWLAEQVDDVTSNPELGGWDNSYYESFARATEAAIDSNRASDAFRFFQLASFDSNAQASQQAALRHAAGVAPGAASKLRAVQDGANRLRMLNVQKASLLAAGKIEPAHRVGEEIKAAELERAGLISELGAALQDFQGRTRAELLPLSQVQARLGADEALFLALPSRSATSMILVRRSGVVMARSPLSRSGIAALVAPVRASVDSALADGKLPEFDLAASHRLYRALFGGDIGRAAIGVRKLHVAATGSLSTLPFSLLVTQAPDKGGARTAHWLIRDMSLDVPITLASLGRNSWSRSGGASFAGIGAPMLAGGAGAAPVKLASLFRGGSVDAAAIRQLPSLPKAGDELDRMRRALAPTKALMLLGPEASEEKVKASDLSAYSVIAFATHGLAAGELESTQEPALVLTPPASGASTDDGLLTTSEIAALRLDADWVILSACNTAAGVSRYAPSYTGFANAFLYAGARGLLLSHWRVRDDVASRLSVDVVRRSAAGVDRAEALRQAMLALMADRKVPGASHPAIWAPFLLIEG